MWVFSIIRIGDTILISEFPLARWGSPYAYEKPTAANLTRLKTGSLTVTQGVIQALQRDPDNAALTARLAGELAMSETTETALLMRRMLITGMSEPNAAAQSEALAEGERRIAALDREISALKNEMALKQVLSRNSILTIIERDTQLINAHPQNRYRKARMPVFLSWKRTGQAHDGRETFRIKTRR